MTSAVSSTSEDGDDLVQRERPLSLAPLDQRPSSPVRNSRPTGAQSPSSLMPLPRSVSRARLPTAPRRRVAVAGLAQLFERELHVCTARASTTPGPRRGASRRRARRNSERPPPEQAHDDVERLGVRLLGREPQSRSAAPGSARVDRLVQRGCDATSARNAAACSSPSKSSSSRSTAPCRPAAAHVPQRLGLGRVALICCRDDADSTGRSFAAGGARRRESGPQLIGVDAAAVRRPPSRTGRARARSGARGSRRAPPPRPGPGPRRWRARPRRAPGRRGT